MAEPVSRDLSYSLRLAEGFGFKEDLDNGPGSNCYQEQDMDLMS